MSKQNLKVKENWRHWTPELAKIFLRSGPEGKSHPSRVRVLSLLQGLSSILDVGCGNGVMFEMIRERRLDLDYLGIDVTERLLQVARQLFPADAHRFRQMSLYDLKKLRRKFDAVVCRHVLEHLPDYVPAVQHLYSCARKKLILVFFLPPLPLSSGRKRDGKFERDPNPSSTRKESQNALGRSPKRHLRSDSADQERASDNVEMRESAVATEPKLFRRVGR